MPGPFTRDIDTLLCFAMPAVVGVQVIFAGLFALALAEKMKLRVVTGFLMKLLRLRSPEGAIAKV